MNSTIIPKDCILCDVCNMQLSDGQFVAIGNSTWYEGWLYCEDCEKKYPEAVKDMRKILEIAKKLTKIRALGRLGGAQNEPPEAHSGRI